LHAPEKITAIRFSVFVAHLLPFSFCFAAALDRRRASTWHLSQRLRPVNGLRSNVAGQSMQVAFSVVGYRFIVSFSFFYLIP
jgi:hypothetical protein